MKLDETHAYVDPITFVLQYVGTITCCNSIAPPRYHIAGKWYCSYPDMLECAAPELFRINLLGIQEMGEGNFTGLGRTIYSGADRAV